MKRGMKNMMLLYGIQIKKRSGKIDEINEALLRFFLKLKGHMVL